MPQFHRVPASYTMANGIAKLWTDWLSLYAHLIKMSYALIISYARFVHTYYSFSSGADERVTQSTDSVARTQYTGSEVIVKPWCPQVWR